MLGEEGEHGTLGEPLSTERANSEAARASFISRHSADAAARFAAREARRRASRFANAPLRVTGGIEPGRALAFVRLIHWMHHRAEIASTAMHKMRKTNQMHKKQMAISAAR